ncbi:MAG: N-acetylmuramoyl-L-alanine amidase [Candidatus Marinimicrobia bacterium]|nr:N-acetylmuramoyl-L-alanine amidase [Candidatus Neomarinimicrobiota bacterium]
MNKFKYLYILIFSVTVLMGQDLTGYKFCINPGHGGHDSDDRYIAATGFWESEGNLTKGLKLRDILEAHGAEIIMTRTQNRTQDDLPLSQIVAIANNNNVDHMHSIHSNGFNGNLNYSLMLFQGFDDDPTYPEAKEMSEIMGPLIKNTNRTSSIHIRGDFDFYGTGQPYLGVFRNLSMPGQLSEGSFHDYIPESWRLQNLDYRRHEAWAIARSFMEFFDAGEFSHGIIAGLVKDAERSVKYNYLTGSDKRLPVNGITITLKPGDKVYHGDNMNNGFFMFDSLEPGEYKVIYDAPFYTADSTTVMVTANQTTFTDINLYSDSTYVGEPEIPTHIQLLVEDAASVRVKFRPAGPAEGYRIYYGTNPSSLSDYVETDTTNTVVTGLSEGSMVYFVVKAWNSIGESLSDPNTYAAIPSDNENKVLIVNGFDRSTNESHNYIRKYNYHLKKIDIGHSYCLNEVIYDGDLSLQEFKTVIWILGDESSGDDTFNPTEQDSVKVFLRRGGQFFVSGSEIGWDLEGKSGHATQADKDFYHNFLKARYIEDAPFNSQGLYYSVEGLSGKIFRDLSDITFDDGTHGTFNVDWPDVIIPTEGAIGCLKYKDVPVTRGFAGISFEGLFPEGTETGRLVYLTVPFETIYPTSARQEIMDRVFEFFNGVFVAVDKKSNEIVSEKFQVFANYPNPFNPTTTIKFSIPHAGSVNLKIFNIRGELVKNYIPETLTAGLQTIRWNADDNNGMRVSAGTYFYQVTFNHQSITQKMLLLK